MSALLTAHFKDGGREVTAGFDRMRSQASRLPAFYTAMKRPAKKDVREHGKDESGPDGAWPERDPAYMKRRRRTGTRRTVRKAKVIGLGKPISSRRARPPRQMLGKLTKSIRLKPTRGGLFIRSPISWAGIHQEGGRAGRGAMIPARPFLWLSSEFMAFATKQYQQFVLTAWPPGTRLKVT